MTGKLRLEDLQVVTEWEEFLGGYRIFVKPSKTRDATIADWVEVGRQLGAEEVEANEKWFGGAEHPIPHMKSGTYLVFRLPVESPTPKDEQ